MCSRRFLAFSGLTSITARRIAARSWAGVSDPARSKTMASAARASAGSSSAVAAAMISALSWLTIPARNAALVPGRQTSSAQARSRICSASPADTPSTAPSSRAVNSCQLSGIWAGPASAQPGAGRRRTSSATAAYLPAAMAASARSRAQITPSSSSSLAPAYRSSSPAASSANRPSVAQPGATSSGSPVANPAAGLAHSPGNDSADPGIPGPRRPATTAAMAARVAAWPERARSGSSYSSGSPGSSSSATAAR